MNGICKFFMPIEQVEKGRYRRYPPTINTVWTGINLLGFHTNYPATYNDKWCSENSKEISNES